jgi:hypothetical protein
VHDAPASQLWASWGSQAQAGQLVIVSGSHFIADWK